MAENHIVKAVITALLAFSCAASVHAQTGEADQIDRALRAREADLKKLEAQIHSMEPKNSYGDVLSIVPEICEAQIPLLDQGIVMSKPQTEWPQKWQQRFAWAHQGLLLERAYCALSRNDDEKAGRLFDEMVAVSIAYRESASSQTLVCLAHAYATGKGVQTDPVRAIGYYALSASTNFYTSQNFCGDIHSYFLDTPRAVAEAVISQDPTAQRDSDSLVYQFLRRGTTRDYLTAVKLFDAANDWPSRNGYLGGRDDSQYHTIYRLALDGLPRSIDGFDEDTAAKSELNYRLGVWSMEMPGLVQTQALTYSFLLAADSPVAREKLAQAYAKTPFILILPDGREWSPSDAP